MDIICDGYPKVQVSKDDFGKIQQAIGGLADELPEEGFTPKPIDTYWAKGLPLWYVSMKKLRIGWAEKCPR
jgi:hypothetical protein